jgi:hypothetical protein
VAQRGRLRHGVGAAGLPCDDIRGARTVRRRGGGGLRVGRLAVELEGLDIFDEILAASELPAANWASRSPSSAPSSRSA